MGEQQPAKHNLAMQLRRAIENYQQSAWTVIDEELYHLCRRRPGQHDYADVYPKVVLIGRAYSAGIARASKAPVRKREGKVARGLMNQADVIDEQLRALAGRPLDQAAAEQIVDLHGRLTRGLADSYTGGVWLTSFVSKYLHFHCRIVPVYDSRAVARIGGFVSRRDARRARHNLSKPPDADRRTTTS